LGSWLSNRSPHGRVWPGGHPRRRHDPEVTYFGEGEDRNVGPHLGFQGIIGVRNWCELTGGDCESSETLPIPEQQAAASAHSGLQGVAKMANKTLVTLGPRIKELLLRSNDFGSIR